jgi:predicted amidohydrolase
VIAVPTNNPVFPRPEDQLPQEAVALRAHAYFNRVFVACCDRCGTERGVEFLGASLIADEQGWAMTDLALGESVLMTAECELERARDKRWNDRNDVFGDRRTEIYADALTAPPRSH